MDPQQHVRQVYAASAARLVAQMYAVTGDYAEAQDVVQEASERTIRAAVRPDGVLAVQAGISAGEDPLMFASSDGGATLRPAPLGPGADPRPVPGGYAQSGWPDSEGAWLSADGVTWAWLDPPELP
ncbi:hypothetical protein [Micromonospora fulviviridis]|uniref:Uncharacterized protein n=1 Tax=Micromonospora fulviviridis TaxID=47860 RepID=A0ABV2VPB3_9ACTN